MALSSIIIIIYKFYKKKYLYLEFRVLSYGIIRTLNKFNVYIEKIYHTVKDYEYNN
jgi:hypothetical protein